MTRRAKLVGNLNLQCVSKVHNDWVEYKRAQNKAFTEYRRAKRHFEKRAENIRMV